MIFPVTRHENGTTPRSITVTLSTAEAEYVAATHTTKECIWLQCFIGKLFPLLITTMTLHCNNQAVLMLATEDNYHMHTKHIDICYHFICKVIASNAIEIIYCPTNNMMADILMKALSHWKVKCHSLGLGLHQLSGGVLESEVMGSMASRSSHIALPVVCT